MWNAMVNFPHDGRLNVNHIGIFIFQSKWRMSSQRCDEFLLIE